MNDGKKVTYVSIGEDEESHRRYEHALIEVEKELGQHHPLFIAGKVERAGRGI